MSELLRVENLHVSVGRKELLHGINLTVNKGEVHVIMGVNGAGKSTLLHAIMGNPVYKVTEGHIYFEGQDITNLSVDKGQSWAFSFLSRTPFPWPALQWKISSVLPRLPFPASSSVSFLSSVSCGREWKTWPWILPMPSGT